MSPDKEVNPLWIWLGENYTQFAIVYLMLFVAVIVLTEMLLKYSSTKRPLVGFFTYSVIIFGCQAHFVGALSNIDGSYYMALLNVLGIPVTKMLDYAIFMIVFFSPVPLSLLAFRAWQNHHSH
jgi:multidrug transporter EmrE-like cation transporter